MGHVETEGAVKDWETLLETLRSEQEQYRKELREIALMVEQSQLELTKLTQRSSSISSHLQQAQFESMSRADIRMAYESAIDAQQRLIVMRGQVEKLQNDQMHLQRYLALIDRILGTVSGGKGVPGGVSDRSSTAEKMEMMIQAQEAERQRLSRQMHDGPAQALSNFILQTEIALRLFDLDQNKAREELVNMKKSAMGTFQKVRDFIFELRPMMLDDLGLVPTLKRYVDAFKDQSGMDVRLTVTGLERRLESYQEVLVFRSIQELLNNIMRHSQATEVNVLLDMGESNLRVTVEDNGKGFDPETLEEKAGIGLRMIRERAEMVGGWFELHTSPGQGTEVVFLIPTSGASL